MTQRERANRNTGAPLQSAGGSRRTGGRGPNRASPELPRDARALRFADLGERINDSPRARRPVRLQPVQPASGAGDPFVVQRLIRGSGIAEVYRLLRNQKEWKSFIDKRSTQSKRYAKALDEMLQSLHRWETGFDPSAIAEAIRINRFDASGVAQAKQAVVGELEEEIDQEVLSGGHSGERHYGKDERFQRERMKAEGKEKVTTLEDSKATKQFFTKVRNSVREDLMALLNPMIWDVAEEIRHQAVTRPLVRSITQGYVDHTREFDAYTITLEAISVTAVRPGTACITAHPKLTSRDTFVKTEYTPEGSHAAFSPIVMYWGRNSPRVQVSTHAEYDALYSALEAAIISPVTAF